MNFDEKLLKKHVIELIHAKRLRFKGEKTFLNKTSSLSSRVMRHSSQLSFYENTSSSIIEKILGSNPRSNTNCVAFYKLKLIRLSQSQ